MRVGLGAAGARVGLGVRGRRGRAPPPMTPPPATPPPRRPHRPGGRRGRRVGERHPRSPGFGQKSTETSGHGRRVDARPHPELLLDLLLELVGEVGVVLEEGAGVLLALPELVAVVGVPGTGLADEAVVDAHVDEAALAGDALAVEDVELGLLERRAHLVLDDLAPGAVADRVGAVLEGLDAPHVEADRRVELQRLATGRRLGRAEHDADLLAELVDEDRGRAGRVEGTGDLAQRLRHEAGLEADVAVAHLALDLGPGHEGRDRVDDDDVEGAGADEHVGDLERLLARVGLGDEERVGVDAELLGVLRVERVLGVDEGGDAAGLLRVGDGVQGDGRLARALRAVDLDDAAAGQPADAERDVERDRAGRDDLDRGAGRRRRGA